MSGLFITIEGGEGSGKSTLIERLGGELDAIVTKEPGGTPLGIELRKILLHNETLDLHKRAELFLFLSDRAQHVETVIRPALKQGKTVLCDRFTDSTLAYQGLARNQPLDELETLCNLAAGITPHITLFIDLDPKIGLERIHHKRGDGFDRIEKEALDFHQKLREAFQFLAKREPERIHTLDGSKTPDEVFHDASAIIAPYLNR